MNNLYIRLAAMALVSVIVHFFLLRSWGKEEVKTEVPKVTTEKSVTESKEDPVKEQPVKTQKVITEKVAPVVETAKVTAEKSVLAKAAPVTAKAVVPVKTVLKVKEDQWSAKFKELQESKRTVLRSKISKGDYRLFLRRLKLGSVNLADSTDFKIAWRDDEELLSVHKYFRMKILAYELANEKKVVELESNAFGDSFQRINDFDKSVYSSVKRPRKEPYFEPLMQKINKQSYLEQPQLVSLTPTGIERYFTFKLQQAIILNQYEKNEVKRGMASFHKTSFGSWILKVEYLELNSGKVVPVQDFEVQKILGH